MGNKSTKHAVYYDEWVSKLPQQDGKMVVVTGASSGTGYWAAITAIRKNATSLCVLQRGGEKNDRAMSSCLAEKEKVHSAINIHHVECNLMSLESVRTAAAKVLKFAEAETNGGVDVVACNAGIMAFPDDRTADGFEVQMQTNHLSHFLLCKLLLPGIIKASENGQDVRIVQQSSGARNVNQKLKQAHLQKTKQGSLGGHGFVPSLIRYGQSKLANTAFAAKLGREMEKQGYTNVKSIGTEPGVCYTELGTKTANNSSKYGLGSKFISWLFYGYTYTFAHLQAAEDGALALIVAMFGKSEDVSNGDLYGPQFGTWGPPFKCVNSWTQVKSAPRNESPTLDVENQDNVWKWSEEELGVKFFN